MTRPDALVDQHTWAETYFIHQMLREEDPLDIPSTGRSMEEAARHPDIPDTHTHNEISLLIHLGTPGKRLRHTYIHTPLQIASVTVRYSDTSRLLRHPEEETEPDTNTSQMTREEIQRLDTPRHHNIYHSALKYTWAQVGEDTVQSSVTQGKPECLWMTHRQTHSQPLRLVRGGD